MKSKVAWNSIPPFTRTASYEVDVPWSMLEQTLKRFAEDPGPLELDPDFQRGHVWTPDKQVRYVEYILRGGKSSRDIFFNHPTWMKSFKGVMQLVDGKQRLEAVRRFLRDDLVVFNQWRLSDFEDRLPHSLQFRFHVNDLPTRHQVLQWYLDLNDGGVAHSELELDLVRELLKAETASYATKVTERGPRKIKTG